jgi:hypothetical protein
VANSSPETRTAEIVTKGRLTLLAFLPDLFRVIRSVPIVEYQRRTLSLHQAVARARRSGGKLRTRTSHARQILRRFIFAVDRYVPGGPNCVRRALLEIRLDGAAARENLFAGFKSGGGPRSGHAWLESDRRPAGGAFDATTVL